MSGELFTVGVVTFAEPGDGKVVDRCWTRDPAVGASDGGTESFDLREVAADRGPMYPGAAGEVDR